MHTHELHMNAIMDELIRLRKISITTTAIYCFFLSHFLTIKQSIGQGCGSREGYFLFISINYIYILIYVACVLYRFVALGI